MALDVHFPSEIKGLVPARPRPQSAPKPSCLKIQSPSCNFPSAKSPIDRYVSLLFFVFSRGDCVPVRGTTTYRTRFLNERVWLYGIPDVAGPGIPGPGYPGHGYQVSRKRSLYLSVNRSLCRDDLRGGGGDPTIVAAILRPSVRFGSRRPFSKRNQGFGSGSGPAPAPECSEAILAQDSIAKLRFCKC